ncbi:hypothetical protein HY251_18540 [bacterium]|nr:hypothetical protein [bacterium]
MRRAAVLLATIALIASAREAEPSAYTIGEPGSGDVRLTYTGAYARGFFDQRGRVRSVPRRGQYFDGTLSLGGDVAVHERVDLQAALAGAVLEFHDELRADRDTTIDLDSMLLGAKALLLKTDRSALALEVELSVPVSTQPRNLYGSSSIDTTLKVVGTIELAPRLLLTGYAALTMRTRGSADLGGLGLDLSFRPADAISLYALADFSTPLDRGDGKTRFGPVLREHRPTALTLGGGAQLSLGNGFYLDLAAYQVAWGKNTLIRTTWSLGLTFLF